MYLDIVGTSHSTRVRVNPSVAQFVPVREENLRSGQRVQRMVDSSQDVQPNSMFDHLHFFLMRTAVVSSRPVVDGFLTDTKSCCQT